MIKIAIILIIVLGFFQTNIKLENENHGLLKQTSGKTIYVFNKANIKIDDLQALDNLEKKQIKIYVQMPTNISTKEENLVIRKVDELERRILQKQKLKLQTFVFYYKLLTINNWEIILNN